MTPGLTRIVPWGHEFLAEVVRPGDLVVDLTAGNGHDTLALARMVGPAGQVIAFDIQADALAATRDRLSDLDTPVRTTEIGSGRLLRRSGIDLVHGSHEYFTDMVPGSPAAVIANLGFLPGGAPDIITRTDSTLTAIDRACDALACGGRVAVVVYPGHPGGDIEAEAVGDYFSRLDQATFQVLLIRVQNRPQAPFLLVAGRKREGKQEL